MPSARTVRVTSSTYVTTQFATQRYARSNFTQKIERSGQGDAERERFAWRQAIWTDIHDAIAGARPPFSLQKASINQWSNISLGRSGFYLSMVLTPETGSIGVNLTIRPKQPFQWKDSAFDQLYGQKEEIEAEIRAPLQWMNVEYKMSVRILLEAKIDLQEPSNRQAVCDCMKTNVPLMYEVFKPLVAGLVAPEFPEPAESPDG